MSAITAAAFFLAIPKWVQSAIVLMIGIIVLFILSILVPVFVGFMLFLVLIVIGFFMLNTKLYETEKLSISAGLVLISVGVIGALLGLVGIQVTSFFGSMVVVTGSVTQSDLGMIVGMMQQTQILTVVAIALSLIMIISYVAKEKKLIKKTKKKRKKK